MISYTKSSDLLTSQWMIWRRCVC